jgi:hypothetical protein
VNHIVEAENDQEAIQIVEDFYAMDDYYFLNGISVEIEYCNLLLTKQVLEKEKMNLRKFDDLNDAEKKVINRIINELELNKKSVQEYFEMLPVIIKKKGDKYGFTDREMYEDMMDWFATRK